MERFILRNIKPAFQQSFRNNTTQRASTTSFLKLKDVTDVDELWMEGKCCDNTETDAPRQWLKRERNRKATTQTAAWSIDSQ